MHSLASLQTLRAAAAWMVVTHHYMQIVHGFQHTSLTGRFFSEVGGFAVEVFFVISGFIMHFSLTKNPIAAPEFMIRRLMRIVPAYWIATLIFVLVIALLPSEAAPQNAWTWPSLAKSLLFWPHQNPSGLGTYPTLTVGWSLNFEMFFYVLLAVVLGLVGKRWFGATVAVLLLLPVLWPEGWLGSAIASSSLIRLFAFGMLLSSLFVRRQGRSLPTSDLSCRWWLALVVSACLVALLGRPLPLLWRVEGLVMQALGCGLVWTVVINENWFQRWPAARFWKYLGDASYSTYLLHPSAMFCLLGLSVTQSTWAKQESFFVAYVVLTGLVSHLSYRVIESGQLARRLQRWFLVKLKR